MTENEKTKKELYSADYDDLNYGELMALRRFRAIDQMKKEDQKFADAEEIKLEKNPPKDKLIESTANTKDEDGDNEAVILAEHFGAENFNYLKMDNSNIFQSFAMTDSDSECPADPSDWEPTEVFPNIIFHAVGETSDLYKACAVKVDIAAGSGSNVEFKFVGSRTPTGGLGACECKSCASNTWTTVAVTISRFADNAIACEFDAWKVGSEYKTELLTAMRLGATRYVNSEIYDAIAEATPGVTSTCASQITGAGGISGSCCTNTDMLVLYYALSDGLADMQNADYDPDIIIMSPEVAGIFRHASEVEIPAIVAGSVVYDERGRLSGLMGLKVVLTTNMPAVAQGVDLAYIIQSKRSVAVAWGKKPVFTKEYRTDCDSWLIGYNAYMGVDSLDDSSICHVVNA